MIRQIVKWKDFHIFSGVSTGEIIYYNMAESQARDIAAYVNILLSDRTEELEQYLNDYKFYVKLNKTLEDTEK